MSSIADALRAAIEDQAQDTTRLLITGASGWLGKNLIELLVDAYGDKFGTRVLATSSSTRKIEPRPGISFSVHKWEKEQISEFSPTHIVHLAFVTRDKLQDMPLEEFVRKNEVLREEILWAIRLPSVRALLSTSSGAVAKLPRDPYAALKIADEVAFKNLADIVGINFLCTRVWSVSGPYIKPGDILALESFISSALANKPIELQAPTAAWRTFMDAKEITGLSLLALMQNRKGILNTGGTTVSVLELAQRVCATLQSTSSISTVGSSVKSNSDYYVSEYPDLVQFAQKQGVTVLDLESQINSTAVSLRV